MNADMSLQASFWTMVILQTIGSVDMPGTGNRKLPAPRAYVPVVIVWAGLQLFADTGHERPAGVAGWVMVLAGLVVGPANSKTLNPMASKVINFLNSVATTYGVKPSSSSSASTIVTPGQATTGTI